MIGSILILAGRNRTKKIETKGYGSTLDQQWYIEEVCIIAAGTLAECNLGVEFLDEFQVAVSFREQCMHTEDENSSTQYKYKRKVQINPWTAGVKPILYTK